MHGHKHKNNNTFVQLLVEAPWDLLWISFELCWACWILFSFSVAVPACAYKPLRQALILHRLQFIHRCRWSSLYHMFPDSRQWRAQLDRRWTGCINLEPKNLEPTAFSSLFQIKWSNCCMGPDHSWLFNLGKWLVQPTWWVLSKAETLLLLITWITIDRILVAPETQVTVCCLCPCAWFNSKRRLLSHIEVWIRKAMSWTLILKLIVERKTVMIVIISLHKEPLRISKWLRGGAGILEGRTCVLEVSFTPSQWHPILHSRSLLKISVGFPIGRWGPHHRLLNSGIRVVAFSQVIPQGHLLLTLQDRILMLCLSRVDIDLGCTYKWHKMICKALASLYFSHHCSCNWTI